MKEQVQKTGVRKWAGQDLVDLQREPLAAITALFEEYVSCIIKGCDVIQKGTTYTITPGMVALSGVDQNGQTTFKVAPFAGVDGVTLPVYLTLTYSIVERPYADLKVKPIAYDFRATATGVRPTDRPYIEIGTAGGTRFVDAIQNSKHRFLTDTERSKLQGIEANANNYVHPAKHQASMIEQDDQNRMVSTAKISEWDAKATTAYVLNKIAELVASSPAALDTLNELAAALGNDPNFATTMTNALAGKAPVNHKHGLDSLNGLDKAQVDGCRRWFRGDGSDSHYWLVYRWMGGEGWRIQSVNDLSDEYQGIHRVIVDEADVVKNGVYTTNDVLISRTVVSTNSGDWNSLVKAGIYQVAGDGSWNGSTNFPLGSYAYGQLCVFTNGSVVTQLYVTHLNSQIWVRSKFNALDWQDWRRIVDTKELASYASIEHVRQKIAELVGSSPAALDTLNELAAALGNDPNFATTVMNSLAGKASTGHTHDAYLGKADTAENSKKLEGYGSADFTRAYADAGVSGGEDGINKQNAAGFCRLHVPGVEYAAMIQLYDYQGNYSQLKIRGYGGAGSLETIKFRTAVNNRWNEIFHTGNFNPATKAEASHNHDDRYQPAGSYLTQQQIEAALPYGIFKLDGSKKEHFLDVICAGSVTQIGERKDYWGENRVGGYPFDVVRVTTGCYKITHSSGTSFYGVIITCRNFTAADEKDNYATLESPNPNEFGVNTFNTSGGWQDSPFNFIMYRLR